jgi:tetratricopeptide (TPR) repeat protein
VSALLGCPKPEDLALLTGAGTSMIAPTNLPSGTEMLRRATRTLVPDDRLARCREDTLAKEGIPRLVPELVFQRFHDILDELPPLLYNPFRSAVPNGVHQLVAELLARGAFVATTNFDLALEAAAHRSVSDGPTARILHLHGRVDDHASLVHTIRAVGRGLPEPIERELGSGVRHRTLYVLGYSGNDREVMHAIGEARPTRVVWIVRAPTGLVMENLAHHSRRLANLSLQVTDLSCVHQVVVQRSGLPAPTIEPHRPSAAAPAVPPLVQLELLLAILLQLQDYSAAGAAAEIAEDLPGEDEQRASICCLKSFAARRSGDLTGATAIARRAIELAARARSTVRGRARTELALALLDAEPPPTDCAAELLHEAYALFEATVREDHTELAETLLASAKHNLGFLHEMKLDYETALAHYRAALAKKVRLGDLPYQITSERDVALMLILLDRPAEAAPHLSRFHSLATEYADPYELAAFDLSLGMHRLHQRRPEDATGALRRARDAFGRIGDAAARARAERLLAEAERNTG